MDKFEKTYLYPEIKNDCLFYARYINDIFIVLKGRSKTEQFLNQLKYNAQLYQNFYLSGFSDHFLLLYCYIPNVSDDMSTGLLQVFVEFGR